MRSTNNPSEDDLVHLSEILDHSHPQEKSMNDKHEQQQTKTSANFRHLNTDTLRAENCLNDDVLPEEERRQLEIYAQQNWDKFYNINKSNFFKDRHWLTREFPQLLSGSESERKCLMEIGCGTGSTIYPLVKSNPFLFCHAFDFSKHAVTLVHTHKRYRPDRVNGFVWDISKAPIPLSMGVKPESVDLITSIFVLSALAPENLLPSAIRLNHVLKMGGQVLFRDYAAGDHAQLRFGTQHKLGDNYHKRSDGTLSKFFTEEELEGIFREAGFECSDMKRSEKLIENRASGVSMDRSWLQAVFTKKRTVPLPQEEQEALVMDQGNTEHSPHSPKSAEILTQIRLLQSQQPTPADIQASFLKLLQDELKTQSQWVSLWRMRQKGGSEAGGLDVFERRMSRKQKKTELSSEMSGDEKEELESRVFFDQNERRLWIGAGFAAEQVEKEVLETMRVVSDQSDASEKQESTTAMNDEQRSKQEMEMALKMKRAFLNRQIEKRRGRGVGRMRRDSGDKPCHEQNASASPELGFPLGEDSPAPQ